MEQRTFVALHRPALPIVSIPIGHPTIQGRPAIYQWDGRSGKGREVQEPDRRQFSGKVLLGLGKIRFYSYSPQTS